MHQKMFMRQLPPSPSVHWSRYPLQVLALRDCGLSAPIGAGKGLQHPQLLFLEPLDQERYLCREERAT
jgi:hypothetical protein